MDLGCVQVQGLCFNIIENSRLFPILCTSMKIFVRPEQLSSWCPGPCSNTASSPPIQAHSEGIKNELGIAGKRQSSLSYQKINRSFIFFWQKNKEYLHQLGVKVPRKCQKVLGDMRKHSQACCWKNLLKQLVQKCSKSTKSTQKFQRLAASAKPAMPSCFKVPGQKAPMTEATRQSLKGGASLSLSTWWRNRLSAGKIPACILHVRPFLLTWC